MESAAAHPHDDTLAMTSASGPGSEHPLAEQPGSIIGHYKLLQRIGEGGFGVVWMADQEHPVRRRVAIKIIKAGMDTRQVIARFEQERQALAMMDHPNIARVLDAGATQTGRPYFVMELVRGLKITRYCDDEGLSTTQRIKLFITVCQAVQHAHQKGIIHRDLKPSNILVTINDGEAVPKVIDFGVAKATQGRLTESTLFTQFEQMIGTPLYMSPEQAELTSLDVDTRSDIYSLGVLLYELLTGRTPIDMATMAKAGKDEVRRLIREVDPPRPSARLRSLDESELTTVAKRRHIDATKLLGSLRGDIDWIVMKCLEKDRKRRYDTANGLAIDLQRHLSNDVVMARPPTTAYLLSKLVRRNKVACIAGAAIVASLLIGVAASVWQAVRAEREATRAEQEAQRAKSAEQRAVAAFDELRAAAPAFAEQARALAAKERFGEAVEKLNYALKLRPSAPELLLAKGDLLQCQFRLADAADVYREALCARPGLTRAEESAKLCDELLAATPNADGKLTRESLAKLLLAMQRQQRPAAELMPVARLLGQEKKLVVEYWLDRLKELSISAEKPLKDRLVVRDDGRLALDLSDTKVIDLSPLAGAPLAALNVSRSRELSDLSPLRGLDLIELDISGTSVADLAALGEMYTLKKLEMAGSQVADVAPLSALRLEELSLAGTQVVDISALRGMRLSKLSLRDTRVADLSPLAGMPLKSFDASTTPASDFRPLAGAPLERCIIQNSPLADLSFLLDSPVKELCLFGCDELRGYSVLAGLKSLDLLILPQSFRNLPDDELAAIAALRDHPTLKNIQTEYWSGGGWIIAATLSKTAFWQDWDREQPLVSALRKSGIKFALWKLPAGTYSLTIDNQPLRDLSILKGAPISALTVSACPFSDLTPIHELKLESFRLSSDSVADLTPLQGMPLNQLYLSCAKIRDLSPLKGLPLRELYVDRCKSATDLAAVAEIATLEKLTVPIQAANIDVLHKLPRLQMLAFNRKGNTYQPAGTVDAFWKDYAWAGPLLASNLSVTALSRLDDGTWDLSLNNSPITDLSVLSGAPISRLWVANTAVADLAPLRGMPIKSLYIHNTQVIDVSPLKGMQLETLFINGTRIADLSALRGMPLTSLRLHDCAELTDLSPLAECKTLRELTLPPRARGIEFLRAFTRLDRVGFYEIKGNAHRPEQTAQEFWAEYDVPWVGALRQAGIKGILKELPDGTWDVNLTGTKIEDLTILKGAPISHLNIGDTAVSDLTPLRGMALKSLRVFRTRVADLRPLAGMPIEKLLLNQTRVTDLSPVRGMPLTLVKLHGCSEITDVSPLADCKTLTNVTLPPNAKNIGLLRSLPRLERISYQEDAANFYRPDKTAAEFWKAFDATKEQ